MSTDLPFVYVASYTEPPGEGMSCYRFDPSSSGLTLLDKTSEVSRVLYLALHPRQPVLYTAGDSAGDGEEPRGLIAAFRIDPETGNLSLLNRQHTGGRTPCYISVDQTGGMLAVAHFRGKGDVGSLCTLPILPDGQVGPVSRFLQHAGSSVHPQRQRCSHVHAAIFDKNNRYLLATDLGRDRLMSYRVDLPSGGFSSPPIAEAALPPGSGPRHSAFHPSGGTLYLINEINSTLTSFAYNASSGELTELQTLSTVPTDFSGQNTCADIHVHPSGKFVYGSNRGHDSLAVFAVAPETRKLSPIGFTATDRDPRGFTLSGDGAFLLAANQNSNNIIAFAVDPETGLLSRIGTAKEVDTPVCLVFADRACRQP